MQETDHTVEKSSKTDSKEHINQMDEETLAELWHVEFHKKECQKDADSA